jgi:Uma2 family endonuclease
MIATIVEEQKQMTAEEYLALERKSLRQNTGKYEFFNRKRKLMAGGTHPHNKTVYNTGFIIGMKSMQQKLDLDITTSETKVISFINYKNYMYPDVVVVEGKPFFEDEHQDILINPMLIIEVLSDSTEAFDRGDKFKSYRQIKSLKEYILISSTKKSIEQFYCDENGRWQFGEAVTEGALKLQSLPLELQFDEVYLNVVFEVTKENIVDDEKDKR